MYKTFTEWKNGHWLEDGEPRKEAYTKDELLLVEMGWKYGFDAGKAQQADRIAELEKFNKAILKKGGYPYEKLNPIAWMSPDGKVSTTEGILFHIPLYTTPQTKPLSDEEIYALWCEADNTELLPEMRLNDGSINYIITTFARLIEERHGIK